uniref:SUN domain-containing protein n=1 Tax=Anopheles farauti TaxID=69004 RepID=A0A182QGE8_9DIPT
MSQPQQTIGDVIESRRRSRSKTPTMNLRVSSDREQNGASETSPGRVKVRKTPAVAVIEEEPPSSQKTASASSQGRSTPVRKTRVVTSDYSSEDISPERARQAVAVAVGANAQLAKMTGQLTQSSVTTTTTTSTKTTTEQTTIVQDGGKSKVSTVQITQASVGGSEQQKATSGKESLSTSSPKKEDATGTQKLTSTTTSTTSTRSSKAAGTTAAAVIRTSTPKNAAQKMATAKVILTPEELQQHAAYKEYLEAGEYWNKYPKTDYTYSELSPHRREVAPGMVAMPNMSRPSLNKHAERVQTMIQRNPEQEAFIRERYTSSRTRLIRSNPYDSNDETDEQLLSSLSSKRSATAQQRYATIDQQQWHSIVSRFFVSIVTFCFTVVDSVRSVFRRREEQHLYYTRIEDERGFFARVYGFVSTLIINLFKRIYLLISSVLFLDAWLLQSSTAVSEQQQAGQRKRRFLLFLLVLLPFLLTGGTLLYLDPSALDTILASLPTGLPNLPELKLPALPELKLPNLPELPAMPNVPLPDVESMKQYAGERWTDLSDLTEFYLEQLKLASQISVDAVRQLWAGTATEGEGIKIGLTTYLLADEDQTIVLPASSRATLALSSISRILPSNLKDSEIDLEAFYRYISDNNSNFRAKLLSASTFLSTLPPSLFGWMPILSWPWSWSWSWTFSGSSRMDTLNRDSIRNTLQRTLSKEEFEELMLHIDAYIDEAMRQKYASQAQSPEKLQKLQDEPTARKEVVTPELTLHVAQVIEQNLKSYHLSPYHLTDGDVETVAEKVRQTLQLNYPQLFEGGAKQEGASEPSKTTTEGGRIELSKEYLAEIQRIVEQQITVHNNHYTIAGPQLEDILARILSSERLSALIDARIVAQYATESEARAAAERQQREALVDDLRKELNDIKEHFSEQLLSSSLQWEERLRLVQQNHKQLEEQLRAYRLENNDLYQKLLADIDNRLNEFREEKYEGVNKVIRENILTILGLNVKEDLADEDLRAWISGLFVARDHFEQRLQDIQAKVNVDVRQEIDRSAERLMKEIGEQIRVEMMLRLEEAATTGRAESETTTEGGVSKTNVSALTEDDVKRIVRDALIVYDADKTGMVDYALESAGGQVLSTRCTESYQANSAEFRIFGIIPIWFPSNTPRTVISPTMEPGQCWAFQGFPGYLVIQLNTEIIVTGFTLEHISKLLVSNGSISSAPKLFTVWALVALNDPEPVLLGSYEYLDKIGSSIQYFPVQNTAWRQPVQIVELRIESNHGNIHYTCLYRFRVHGDKV